jgi:hypothetical protein
VEGVPKQQEKCLVLSWPGYRLWFRQAQGERWRFKNTQAEPTRWVGGRIFLQVNFMGGRWLGGWLSAENLKHGVYVVPLSICWRSKLGGLRTKISLEGDGTRLEM